MSSASAAITANGLREAVTGYLWRQWKAVGATTSASSPARIIVDPETLILMSLWLVEHERRLLDVAWSWVEVNSPLLSIQRLGNLRKQFPADVARMVSQIAVQRVQMSKDPRWKSLADERTEALGVRDAKRRAVEPRLTSWATLMLQLRLGLGVGIKADVLTLLLGINPSGSEWLSVAAIADALRYTHAAVRRAADDLARARFIRTLDTGEGAPSGQRMFSCQAAPWVSLLGVGIHNPGWGYWTERYLFLIEVITWLDREEAHPTEAYPRDVQARDILTRHSAALRKDRIIDSQEFAIAELNFDYLVQACGALLKWLRENG